MSQNERDDNTIYKVVVSHEEMYLIRPALRKKMEESASQSSDGGDE